MNVFISIRDNHPLVAIMALPDKWLSLFDVEKLFKAQDTTSWDTPCLITKGALATDSFKRVEHDAYPGRNKAAAIVAFLPAFINRLILPSLLTVLFFNQMEHQWSQYSTIPLFHYSNCERSELSSLFYSKHIREKLQRGVICDA